MDVEQQQQPQRKRTDEGEETRLIDDQRTQCERYRPQHFEIDTELTWQLIYVINGGQGLVYRHQELGRPLVIRYFAQAQPPVWTVCFQSPHDTITADDFAEARAIDITARVRQIGEAYIALGPLRSLDECDAVEADFLAKLDMTVVDAPPPPPEEERRIVTAKRGQRRGDADSA